MWKGFRSQSQARKQHTMPKQRRMERPSLGQGRAGSERKRPDPINQSINQPSTVIEIPGRTEIETRKTNHVHTKDLTHSINSASGRTANNNPVIPDVPFHPAPVYRPPPKPSGKMYHILKVHRVQLISKISIQILILKKTLHFRRV